MLREKSQFLTNIHKILDVAWVVLAYVLAYRIKRDWLPLGLSGLVIQPNYYLILVFAAVICYFSFLFFSFYESYRAQSFVKIFTKISKAVGVSVLGLIFCLFLFHIKDISRLFLGIFAFLLLTLLTCSKFAIYAILRYHRKKDYNTRNVLIVGTQQMAAEMIKAILNNPGSGYRIIGCLDTFGNDNRIGTIVYGGVKVIGTLKIYPKLLLEKTVDEVIFAQSLEKIEDINETIHFAEELGIHVRIMPDFQLQKIMFRPETARIYLEQFVGMPTIAISSISPRDGELAIKIFVDYLCAGIGLAVFAPVFVIVAICIKVTSSGPILFLQERCGLNGRHFSMIKFRTMVVDAEDQRTELEHHNVMDGPVFKMIDDPRITPIGKILRKTSLDELPQLVNILKGEMSLVGPRPPIPAEVENYKPWQRRRLSMKPGLTCIWQVSGRNNLSFEDWMRLDLQYIDTWSPWLDIKILLLTIREVISCNGH